MGVPRAADAKRLKTLLTGKKVLFLAHTRPDLDTLASAYALSLFFAPYSKTTFGIPDPLNTVSALLQPFQIKPKTISSLASYDAVVCVDFRSPQQGGSLSHALSTYPKTLILIDHHSTALHSFSRKTIPIIRPHSIATAQMVTRIGRAMKASFPSTLATLLATAILADSARFAVANPHTFETFDFLLQKSPKTYEELLLLAFPPPPTGNRLALFKAARAAKIFTVGDYLLAFIHAPYHTAFAASSFIQLGADLAVGYARDPHHILCSIRVSEKLHHDLDLDILDIILPFAQQHDGDAGGHARAAQLNIPAYMTEETLIDLFTKQLLMRIRAQGKHAHIRLH
ncbi:MAG: DHH family phosphoesterase [Candidatus Diapherotrites archaeon]|nr:DHH family phosphoesterase [Candidatus Diapherotrites archaeon]MDZ4256133.1 DHH family phosphoesterase [archaeon]